MSWDDLSTAEKEAGMGWEDMTPAEKDAFVASSLFGCDVAVMPEDMTDRSDLIPWDQRDEAGVEEPAPVCNCEGEGRPHGNDQFPSLYAYASHVAGAWRLIRGKERYFASIEPGERGTRVKLQAQSGRITSIVDRETPSAIAKARLIAEGILDA